MRSSPDIALIWIISVVRDYLPRHQRRRAIGARSSSVEDRRTPLTFPWLGLLVLQPAHDLRAHATRAGHFRLSWHSPRGCFQCHRGLYLGCVATAEPLMWAVLDRLCGQSLRRISFIAETLRSWFSVGQGLRVRVRSATRRIFCLRSTVFTNKWATTRIAMALRGRPPLRYAPVMIAALPTVARQCSSAAAIVRGGASRRYASSSSLNLDYNRLQYKGASARELVSNRPLICAIGWLGAKPRHFQKYLDWYARERYATLSCIPPLTNMYA